MKDISREDFNNAISTINKYHRQLTGKGECVLFYVDYVQPMREVVNKLENKEETK